jgi:hypothetical protein
MLFEGRHLEANLLLWIDRVSPGMSYARAMSEPLGEFVATITAVFAVITLVELLRAQSIMANCVDGWMVGAPIKISENFGPAAFGFFSPRLVIPRWLLETDPETRTAALAHEQEHIEAHDGLVSLAALALLLLMPWNPALHWQITRLRLAIEYDCDARVVWRHRILSSSAYIDALRKMRRTGKADATSDSPIRENSFLGRRIAQLVASQRFQP